jgi:hypothetical protein
MTVLFEDGTTNTYESTLKIKVPCTLTEFYVNDISYENLPNTTICTKDSVNFRAEIEELNPNPGSLKWYIDGVEEETARDQLQWSKSLPTGIYEIEMWVRLQNNETASIISTLKVEVFWVKIKNIKY